MKVIVVNKLEENLRIQWLKLWQNSKSANFVNSPYWFESVLENFKYRGYVIILCFDGKKLLAVIPMFKIKKYGINFFSMIPEDFGLGLPFLINTKEKKQIFQIVKSLTSLGNIFVDNIPEDILADLNRNSADIDCIQSSSNYYLLPEKDNIGRVIIDNRKKLLTRIKRFEEKFEVKTFTGEVKKALETAFKIDRLSSKNNKGYDAFSNNKIKNFYKSLAEKFKQNFLVSILYYNKTPIAYSMGFIVGTTYFASQKAYINEYSSYTPGKVLAVKLIDYLGSIDIQKIDFGSGDDDLKRAITNNSRPLFKAVVSKNKTVRIYIQAVYFFKNKLFAKINNYPRIYTFYCLLKKKFQHNYYE